MPVPLLQLLQKGQVHRVSDFPYFPLYVSDLLGDDKVIIQDLTQFGAYMRLLCLAWQQKPPATIPSDDAVIAKMLGITISEWAGLKPTVIQCWQLRGDRYYNKRLRQVFDEMIEARRKRQSAGQLGGNQSSSNAKEVLKHSGGGSGDGSGIKSGSGEWNPTAEQLRLNALFHRRPTTRWTAAELKSWKAITPLGEEDLSAVERFFHDTEHTPNNGFRRHDLYTLLNNFNAEVDRARSFKEPTPL